MKTPRLQGVASALAKLEHSLESDAQKLLDRIEETGVRGHGVFKGAHAKLDEAHQQLNDVGTMLDAIGSNGGPTLGDSSQSPQPSGEPQTSWAGK